MNQKELLKRIARQFIPNAGTIVLVIVLLWAQQAGALGFLAPDAASTSTISYQGRLADSSGNPVTNAGLGMKFRLYNAATGGSALWTETYSGVPVNGGLFHVLLGSVTPIPASLFSSNSTLYLGITVGADTEMTPREQLASAPYAMQASQALTVPDGSITTAKIADGAVTLSKLGEQPYYFTGAFATPSEWMADVVFNGNYARFCQAIGRTFSRADELQAHYTEPHPYGDINGRGNGHIYSGWYYVGTRVHPADTHVYGNGKPDDHYNVWKYNGDTYTVVKNDWTYERSVIIWCKP